MINIKESIEKIKEALNVSQRLLRSRIAKKNKNKLLMGRKRASRKVATGDILMKRAVRDAKTLIIRKMTKGKTDLSAAEKSAIELRLSKMKPRIQALARKLLPRVKERDRMKTVTAAQDGNKSQAA